MGESETVYGTTVEAYGVYSGISKFSMITDVDESEFGI